MAVSDVNAEIDAAIVSIKAQAWDAARLSLIAAQAERAKLPNTKNDGQELEWIDEQISKLIDTVGREQSRRAGITTTKINKVRVTA